MVQLCIFLFAALHAVYAEEIQFVDYTHCLRKCEYAGLVTIAYIRMLVSDQKTAAVSYVH
jgi:hypothetical protein